MAQQLPLGSAIVFNARGASATAVQLGRQHVQLLNNTKQLMLDANSAQIIRREKLQ